VVHECSSGFTPTLKAVQLARCTPLETFSRDHHVRYADVIAQPAYGSYQSTIVQQYLMSQGSPPRMKITPLFSAESLMS
jgi:hypothetical protein